MPIFYCPSANIILSKRQLIIVYALFSRKKDVFSNELLLDSQFEMLLGVQFSCYLMSLFFIRFMAKIKKIGVTISIQVRLKRMDS